LGNLEQTPKRLIEDGFQVFGIARVGGIRLLKIRRKRSFRGN
jgi:hypothetical protein